MVMSYLFVLHDSVFLTTTEESIFCCLLCDQTTTQPALLYLTTIDVGFDGVLGEPAQGAIPPSKDSDCSDTHIYIQITPSCPSPKNTFLVSLSNRMFFFFFPTGPVPLTSLQAMWK